MLQHCNESQQPFPNEIRVPINSNCCIYLYGIMNIALATSEGHVPSVGQYFCLVFSYFLYLVITYFPHVYIVYRLW